MPDSGNGELPGASCTAYAKAGGQCGRSADKAGKEVFPGCYGEREQVLTKKFIDSKIAPEQVAGRMDVPM